VSDRFHLIKNLTDNAKQHISKVVSSNFRIPAKEGETGISGGYWENPELHGADLPVRRHRVNTEKKRALVEKVRSLASQGLSITAIVLETGISGPTVRKYLDKDFNPENKDYGSNRPSKLKPYTEKIDAMLMRRCTFKEIEAAIRADGYNGVDSTIRMYAAKKRRTIKEAAAEALSNTELIERKWMTKLLYQPIGKVKGITEEQVERVVREYPVIGILYDIVRSFKEIVFTKQVDDIDDWMAVVTKYGIYEIDSFVSGISADLDAVRNAIRYDYNNGIAEGCINKLKLTKRIMYGRCSFNLLRNKSILKEFS